MTSVTEFLGLLPFSVVAAVFGRSPCTRRDPYPRRPDLRACARSLSAATVALAAFLLLSPEAAYCHSRLLSASPENNSVLHEAPREVVLEFSAPVEGESSRFELLAEGLLTEGEHPAVPLSPTISGKTVRLTLGKLSQGTHRVRWSVLSYDAHRQEGTLVFTVEDHP